MVKRVILLLLYPVFAIWLISVFIYAYIFMFIEWLFDFDVGVGEEFKEIAIDSNDMYLKKIGIR